MKKNKVLGENEFHIKALERRIKELEKENDKIKILLREADPDASADLISDAEYITINQIDRLKTVAKERELTTDEVKNLDILNKILRTERGQGSRISKGGKVKKMTNEELEELAKG
jgi:hypothetical protein